MYSNILYDCPYKIPLNLTKVFVSIPSALKFASFIFSYTSIFIVLTKSNTSFASSSSRPLLQRRIIIFDLLSDIKLHVLEPSY